MQNKHSLSSIFAFILKLIVQFTAIFFLNNFCCWIRRHKCFLTIKKAAKQCLLRLCLLMALLLGNCRQHQLYRTIANSSFFLANMNVNSDKILNCMILQGISKVVCQLLSLTRTDFNPKTLKTDKMSFLHVSLFLLIENPVKVKSLAGPIVK